MYLLNKCECVHESQSQPTLNMLSDEGVVHYVAVIRLQDFLKFCDVIVLVGARSKL